MNAILLSLALSVEASGQTLPAPAIIPPVPEGLVVPPTLVLPPKPPTFEQFVATFVPAPGIHDVTLIHPVTKRPVNVVFKLPDQPLKKTYNSKTRVTFAYGKTEVTLIFRLIGGKVDVRYD